MIHLCFLTHDSSASLLYRKIIELRFPMKGLCLNGFCHRMEDRGVRRWERILRITQFFCACITTVTSVFALCFIFSNNYLQMCKTAHYFTFILSFIICNLQSRICAPKMKNLRMCKYKAMSWNTWHCRLIGPSHLLPTCTSIFSTCCMWLVIAVELFTVAVS